MVCLELCMPLLRTIHIFLRPIPPILSWMLPISDSFLAGGFCAQHFSFNFNFSKHCHYYCCWLLLKLIEHFSSSVYVQFSCFSHISTWIYYNSFCPMRPNIHKHICNAFWCEGINIRTDIKHQRYQWRVVDIGTETQRIFSTIWKI